MLRLCHDIAGVGRIAPCPRSGGRGDDRAGPEGEMDSALGRGDRADPPKGKRIGVYIDSQPGGDHQIYHHEAERTGTIQPLQVDEGKGDREGPLIRESQKSSTNPFGYVNQFKEKLGFVPYPGTLNVEIQFVERNKLRLLKNYRALTIDEFQTENRTFGSVRCFKADVNGSEGAIVLPLRSHYSNILEFISPHNLREKLNLKDGDEVKIIIYLEK